MLSSLAALFALFVHSDKSGYVFSKFIYLILFINLPKYKFQFIHYSQVILPEEVSIRSQKLALLKI